MAPTGAHWRSVPRLVDGHGSHTIEIAVWNSMPGDSIRLSLLVLVGFMELVSETFRAGPLTCIHQHDPS